MYDYVWTKANASDSRLVLSTADQRRVSERVLGLDLDAEVVLRSGGPDEAARFRGEGAAFVVVPDLLASERLTGILVDLLDGDVDRKELKRRHLAEMETIDARGLSSYRASMER